MDVVLFFETQCTYEYNAKSNQKALMDFSLDTEYIRCMYQKVPGHKTRACRTEQGGLCT